MLQDDRTWSWRHHVCCWHPHCHCSTFYHLSFSFGEWHSQPHVIILADVDCTFNILDQYLEPNYGNALINWLHMCQASYCIYPSGECSGHNQNLVYSFVSYQFEQTLPQHSVVLVLDSFVELLLNLYIVFIVYHTKYWEMSQ